MKKTFVAGFILVQIILSGCQSENLNTVKNQDSGTLENTITGETTQPTNSLSKEEEAEIIKLAFLAVEEQTKGIWEKKVALGSIDSSLTAVKGYWWTSDMWDWIGWKDEKGHWKILVSSDGFDCKEGKNIPKQHAAFFRNVLYPNFGGRDPEKFYCHDNTAES